MGCGLFSGGVFRGAAFGNLEAEGLADVELSADERRDELRPVRVLDAPDGAHLIQDLKRGRELLVQVRGLPDVADV